MYNLTRLIHIANGVDDARLERLRGELHAALTPADRVIVAQTLPGSRNGGDILVHARFPDRPSRDAAVSELDGVLATVVVTHVDGVDYTADLVPDSGSTGTVYRTLLLAVDPATPAHVIEKFEADLLIMPRYVHTITACRLSHPERTLGASGWTHVFEQQFTDEQGLMGPYLMHPIHWGLVDRWFDPECPEYIVRERVCHSFCLADEALLT